MQQTLRSIELDTETVTPLHVQLACSLERLIRTGVLKEGDRLPPTTELMKIWGLNNSRVQRAMTILVANGLVAPDQVLILVKLDRNADQSMLEAAAAQFALTDRMPNEHFYIHESSPTDRGTGRPVQSEHIRQFPGDAYAGGDGSTPLSARDAASKGAKETKA